MSTQAINPKDATDGGDAQTSGPKGGHEPALDGLRLLAFLCVFAFHSSRAFGWSIIQYFYPLGVGGVWAFFVLSGFLIGGILLKMRDIAGMPLKEKFGIFYARRSLRIFPVYYLVLALTTLLAAHGLPRLHEKWTDPWDWFYLTNIVFYTHSDWPGPSSHLWTLSVEEQFYLIAPLFLLAVSVRTLSWTFVAIWIACAAARVHSADNIFASVLPTMQFDCLTLGIAAAMMQKFGHFLGVRPRTFAVVGIVFGVLAVPTNYSMWAHQPWMSAACTALGQWLFCAAVAAFVLALWNGKGGVIRRLLGLRPIAYLGKISYGLYLYHLFCLDAMLYSVHALANHPLTAEFVGLGLTIIISAASWHLFEKPINDLKRFFPYRTPTVDAGR